MPTLYHLLPVSQRPATFTVGRFEYDPLKAAKKFVVGTGCK